MEPRQIMMLTVLLLSAVIGIGGIIYILMNLDNEDENENEDNEQGGGH